MRDIIRVVTSPYAEPQVKRSMELLQEYLTEDQWESFTRKGYFELRGSDGATYRIFATGGANVQHLTTGRMLWVIFDYLENAPIGDLWLAQKLFLENDAPGFIRISCTW